MMSCGTNENLIEKFILYLVLVDHSSVKVFINCIMNTGRNQFAQCNLYSWPMLLS